MKAVNGDRRSTAKGSQDLPTTYTHLRSKWRLGWRRGGAASERALGACAAEEALRAPCTRWIVVQPIDKRSSAGGRLRSKDKN